MTDCLSNFSPRSVVASIDRKKFGNYWTSTVSYTHLLTKRKKEIGIYVFMGLTNQKIGKLYAIETIFLGLVALVLGVGFGIITSKLFVMITMAISKISVDISFHFSITPVLITAIIFIIIYAIFVLKGYISIVRSSVLQMVAANRQNEYVQAKTWLLVINCLLYTSFSNCYICFS